MSEIDIEKVIEVGTRAGREAGCLIKSVRDNGNFEVNYKGSTDLVTSADLEADALICKQIRTAFPDHQILSEESAPRIEKLRDAALGPLWIIDPVDGTSNYAHGHPVAAVSIAFAYDGKIQFGIVDAPFLGDTFVGIRGKGATRNGKPIRVREVHTLQESLVATGFPYQRDNLSTIIKRVYAVLSKCRDIRRLGACAIDVSWVACGRLDAFYEDVKPWDIAAAGLIAREAGAMVGHIYNVPDSAPLPPELCAEGVLVANPAIFHSLQRLLQDAEASELADLCAS